LADTRDERVLELCHRVKALEQALANAHRTPRVGRACVGLLLLSTGWVMAQSPAPGQLQSIDPGDAALIRKGPDGVTRVSGPFQVEDAGGKVILSVGAADNTAAAISIALANGHGRLTTFSSSGGVASIVGSQAGGAGMFTAADSSGRPRAMVLGDTGAHMTLNEAGKQVALSGSFNGKGVIGIYSDRSQRLAVLTEAAGGGGELTIHDKSHTKVALLAGNAAGGLLEINAPGKTAAAVDLSVEGGTGAGYVSVLDGAGKRAAALAGATAEGSGALVIERDGQSRASVTLNDAGAGQLVLANPQGGPGLTANGTLETGGRGAGIQIFNGDGDQVIGMGSRDDGSGTVNVQEQGKLLIALQRDETGKGGKLRVNNAEGQAAVEATGPPEGGALAVFNKSADLVATMETSNDNKGSITIIDTDKAVAEITANADGAGRLLLKGRDGNTGVEAAAGGGGAVIVSNKAGDPVAALLSSGTDKGAVSILQDGRTVAEVTATAEGTGYAYVADAQGNITLDADGKLGELTALNKDQVLATFGASSDGHGRIAVHGKAGPVAEVRESGDAGVISVRSAKNVPVAGIVGNGAGGGAVVAANASGAVLAQMGATSDGRGEIKVLEPGAGLLAVMAKSPTGGGAIEVYSNGVAVANLRPGKAGGGYLQLLDAGGRVMVEAGSEAVGVVRAGPNFKCGSNYLGLKVPDCIVGLQ